MDAPDFLEAGLAGAFFFALASLVLRAGVVLPAAGFVEGAAAAFEGDEADLVPASAVSERAVRWDSSSIKNVRTSLSA